MTNKFQLHRDQISKALSNKDFDSLYSLFASNGFSHTELLIFYKRNKKILEYHQFWNSKLPHFHLDRIFESDLKVTFIQCYFSTDSFCNNELNSHLFAISKYEYIKFIKLIQAFNKTSFYNSLIQLSASDSELKRVVKEFDIIIKAQKNIANEATADEYYFLQFSFEEVALAFSLFYQSFKQNDQVTGNKNWQTKIEMALVDELTNIISLFKGKSNMAIQFANNEELQKYFQRNEAPHHILGKKGLNIPVEPKFQLLYNLIDRLIDRNSRRGQIQLYLGGYSDFQSVILNPAPLKTNRIYRTFKINDAKSTPEEMYFSTLRLDFSKPQDLSKTNITSSLETLNFYGVPDTIRETKNPIELKKALQLLKHFSVYKGPAERTFINESYIVMNQGDKLFVELFGSNESVTLFDFGTLSNGISKYFKWSDEETKAILSFLTFEITSNSLSYSWVNRPFLKFSNQVLWLGSFLKDRRWDNILLNKIKRDSEFKLSANVLAKNFEKKIEELFQYNSFKTMCGLPYKSSNGQSGDFDVLAFKGNCLIVCEAKTGIRSDEFIHAAKSEAYRLEGCAADQLEKAIFNIKEDWTNIKAKIGIDKGIELEEIKIIPLIITDYFEGDLQLYKNSILKTSLLELDVILKNKKKDLLELYLLFKPFMNYLNADVKQQRSIVKDWDLWQGKKEIEVEAIIQNIEQNTIWKELESVWKFEDETYTIDY